MPSSVGSGRGGSVGFFTRGPFGRVPFGPFGASGVLGGGSEDSAPGESPLSVSSPVPGAAVLPELISSRSTSPRGRQLVRRFHCKTSWAWLVGGFVGSG